jgi:hypothetical protein
MRPPRIARVGLSALMLFGLVGAAACASAPEEEILDNYFRASRLRDNQTLANIATVAFRPQQEGVVQQFNVTAVGEEQRRTLHLKELAEAYEKARREDEEFTKRKKEYQDANIEAIGRVLKAEAAGTRVSGRDAEVQKAWTKWREETAQYAKRVQEAREALDNERAVVEVSVYDPRNPVDVTKCTGELVTKEVTINARVRQPDGNVATKTLVVTMQRAQLKSPEGREIPGRWIITGVREAGGAPATS